MEEAEPAHSSYPYFNRYQILSHHPIATTTIATTTIAITSDTTTMSNTTTTNLFPNAQFSWKRRHSRLWQFSISLQLTCLKVT